MTAQLILQSEKSGENGIHGIQRKKMRGLAAKS